MVKDVMKLLKSTIVSAKWSKLAILAGLSCFMLIILHQNASQGIHPQESPSFGTPNTVPPASVSQQFPSNNNQPDHPAQSVRSSLNAVSKFQQVKIKSTENMIYARADLPVSQSAGKPLPEENERGGFVLEVNPLVHKAVNFLDKYMDTESEGYQAVKSMFLLWNPKASKWATSVSGRYRKEIDSRTRPPPDWYDEPDRDSVVNRSVTVERCSCTRTISAHTMISYEGEDFGGNSSISACSEHSFLRGSKQKVIAYSFYGDPDSPLSKKRKYFDGIQQNLDLMSKFYPGWTMRVYYDLAPEDPLMGPLCDLVCKNSHIDICYVKQIPSLGDISKVFAMNWRFFPLSDPQVSHMASRDLDSLINEREAAAVKEWLKSDKAFHIMRDHPAHCIEILGSAWGVRLGALERRFVDESFEQGSKDLIFWAKRGAYGPDQGFLKRYIWPWAKWSAVSHDAYTCMQYPRTSPFPVQRRIEENNFVASVVFAKDILRQPCPIRCRPKDHQDWEYC